MQLVWVMSISSLFAWMKEPVLKRKDHSELLFELPVSWAMKWLFACCLLEAQVSTPQVNHASFDPK